MAANYVLLERIELNASAASVTFSNIPQSGYTDLKIVMSVRTNRSDSEVDLVNILINNNTSAIYSARVLYGTGASTASGNDPNQTKLASTALANGNTATANTFGNTEVYIPNYTSSNAKSVSADGVSENNGTTGFQWLAAGLFNSSSAISSLTFSPANSTLLLQYSTFSLYGLAAVGTTPVIAPKASGGNITTDGTYWYHTFLSTGTFTPATSLTCDYLVVAGGGAGGSRGSAGAGEGGGGAGGFLGFSNQSLTTTSYTVTVGAGGTAVTAANGTNGSNSQFGSSTLVIGGGGGSVRGIGNAGGNGGSGGGCTYLGTPGSGTAGQGNAGGNAAGSSSHGSGGGGAGATGGNASGSACGDGGIGLNTYSTWATATSSGVSGYYAGGGGGANSAGTLGNGGSGGGTAGSLTTASNAANNTGGGGGAGETKGGNGGSGIVIVRYTIA